jgi:16S rRNA (adenine(1408)-N(1))-methyltransferase
VRVQRGKKTVDVSREELNAATSGYAKVLVDLGTGDGKFVYRWAVQHPDTFCIGLDAIGDNLQEVSAKVARKHSKGGIANAVFVVAAVENLPLELNELADTITINYPWGSLLSALVTPDESVLRSIARLGKPNSRFLVLLNYSVFQDSEYAERLGLPELTADYVESVLKTRYRLVGIEIEQYRFLQKEAPHRTSWGQSLILGGGRETLVVEGVVRTTAGSER